MQIEDDAQEPRQETVVSPAQRYSSLLSEAQEQLSQLAVRYRELISAGALQQQHHEESIDALQQQLAAEEEAVLHEADSAHQQALEKVRASIEKARKKIIEAGKKKRRELRSSAEDYHDYDGEIESKKEQAFADANRKIAHFKERAAESEQRIRALISKLPHIHFNQNSIPSINLDGASPFNRLADLDKKTDTLNEHIGELISVGARFKASAFVTLVQQLLLLLIVGGTGYGLWQVLSFPNPYIIPGITGATWLSFALWLIFARTRMKRRRIKGLSDDVRQAHALLKALDDLSTSAQREFDPESLLEQTVDKILAKKEREEKHFKHKKQLIERRIAEQEAEEKQHMAELDKKLAAEEERVNTAAKTRTSQLKKDCAAKLEQRISDTHADEAQQLADNKQQQQDVCAERDRILTQLQEEIAADNAVFGDAPPAWSDGSWQQWQPVNSFNKNLPLAQLTLDLDKLLQSCGWSDMDTVGSMVARLHLQIPESGLLLSHGSGPAAVAPLQQVMLRALCQAPPGHVRLCMLDPRGLGDNFAPFLSLPDYDEHLAGPKVWTSQSEIEEALLGLSEHAEKVIQKFLRHQYKTLDDYNAAAGELAEPYHVLVVAGFPHGFSPIAIERLAALLNYGARCGILVWMQHDHKEKIPKEFDTTPFKQQGIVLRQDEDSIALDDEELRQWPLQIDTLPDQTLLSQMLERIGSDSAGASSRALPMTAGTPDDTAIWSSDSGEILRIPIGRSGAERLQYLELGVGTAQHVLIGGRTGSGKSTLLHILITCGALWYGPDQLEYYLVDFKKGVEFKTYASNKLPHARVIAVESDREYALSVLRTLDAELERRGQLFRKAEVQDLASYRAACPDQHMPRSLLVIDEFHEFFTEDDGIARDAALLLERFVRQGRAFGLHIILGSQSIAGSMSLARSAIGQIGVRIALQCNEADSQLILSEENTAARLLERPGEAIYNGRSGQVEGNDPFQVFWLSEDEQSTCIQQIASRAPADSKAAWVFEGNVPAYISNNQELMQALRDDNTTVEARPQCWLGEPNAIKGPTELRFAARPGSNLLMVGHHREAVYGMMQSALLSFAARYQPGQVTLLVVDGDDADPRLHTRLKEFALALPHQVKWLEAGAGVDAIADLGKQVADGAQADVPDTIVFILGLGRLRALRQEDDFSFGMSDSEPDPGQRFADLLQYGPEQHIHCFVWAESPTIVSTALQRATLRHFELRLLFQMSSGDSSELIDDGSASRLGLHHALLCNLESLQREKFRPCVLADAEESQQLLEMLGTPQQQ